MQTRVILGSLLILAVLVSGCITIIGADSLLSVGRDSVTREAKVVKDLAIAPTGLAKVQTVCGDISVSAWDGPRAEVVVVKRVRGAVVGDGQAELDALVVDFEERNGNVSVTVHEPEKRHGVSYVADVELHLPAGARLDVGTVNGDVKVSGLSGEGRENRDDERRRDLHRARRECRRPHDERRRDRRIGSHERDLQGGDLPFRQWRRDNRSGLRGIV